MDTVKTYNILVVEDNEPINRLFCRHLSALGYQCSGVYTADEALQIISNEPPNLILLDFELPDGYGTRVLDRLYQQQMDVATIVISASPRAFTLRHTSYNIDHILVKPISPSLLSELVQKTLISRSY